MNQTGTLSTGWHRQARTNAESATATQATLPEAMEPESWCPSTAPCCFLVDRRAAAGRWGDPVRTI
jgi:hypothetical protein